MLIAIVDAVLKGNVNEIYSVVVKIFEENR